MKRLFLGILAICWVIGVKAQEVFSPDGKINVRFFLSEKYHQEIRECIPRELLIMKFSRINICFYFHHAWGSIYLERLK